MPLKKEDDVRDLKAKLNEFRQNNKLLFHELEQLRPLAAKFEGIDPDKYRELEALEAEVEALRAQQSHERSMTMKSEERNRLADEEIAQRLQAARFREQFGELALAAGVRGKAVKHVLRDAVEVFTLTDDGFVPINGDRDPANPLSPLSPQRWLEQVKTREPFLFV